MSRSSEKEEGEEVGFLALLALAIAAALGVASSSTISGGTELPPVKGKANITVSVSVEGV